RHDDGDDDQGAPNAETSGPPGSPRRPRPAAACRRPHRQTGRGLELPDRIGEATLLLVHDAQVLVRDPVIGVHRHSFLVVRDRVVQLTALPVYVAEVAVRGRVGRIELDRASELARGGIPLLPVHVGNTQLAAGHRRGGGRGNGLLERPHGAVDVARGEFRFPFGNQRGGTVRAHLRGEQPAAPVALLPIHGKVPGVVGFARGSRGSFFSERRGSGR